MKKQVLLITENYPFYPGEQFLEDEIRFWAEAEDIELTIAPLNSRGEPRPVPETIQVNKALFSKPRSFKHYIQGLASPHLWRECIDLFKRGRHSSAALIDAVKASIRIQQAFASLMAEDKYYDIVYCYWNDVRAYAAAMAKRAGKCSKLISRAHRFDLYEERRTGKNQPLKRQFVKDFDQLFLISEEARRYFLSTFGKANVAISRLGVPVSEGASQSTTLGKVRILSVSFCVPVKRIDRIMDGVVEFARKRPDIYVEWFHFGDGPLHNNLVVKALEITQAYNNLDIRFAGELPNQEVRKRMLEEPWSCLINASESEGVPVSIMEAMSFGIPAVATNVGGVAELVDSECGVLMQPDAEGKDIADAISKIYDLSFNSGMRERCKKKIYSRYNSSENYRSLIKQVNYFMFDKM